MIEAVIFDCDGVLADSEILAIEVELAALAEIGLDYTRPEFVERFTGMSNAAFFAALEDDLRRRTGRDFPEGFVDACHAKYLAAFERLAEVPGARAAVQGVAYPKAVASSSNVEQLKLKLRKLDLWDLFDPHIYSADHVVHAKPAPDLFLYAARELGVEPFNCLGLEDSVNGVRAARAAGMRVWGFLGGGHMDDASGPRLLAAGAERLIADWPDVSVAIAALR
jgi:HAD superfamily hydrolase (TIGR01509 family)